MGKRHIRLKYFSTELLFINALKIVILVNNNIVWTGQFHASKCLMLLIGAALNRYITIRSLYDD